MKVLDAYRDWFEVKSLFAQCMILSLYSFVFVFIGLIISLFIATHNITCSYDCNFFQYCRALFFQKVMAFPDYYALHLRGHFFAGYISLGAFLLTLKTFIIIGMKSYVYDDEKYIKLYKERLESEGESDEELKRIYVPLRQLSNVIYYAIVVSLLTAVAQVSLGLIDSILTTFICLWLVVFSTLLLFKCLRLIKQNIDQWLESY